MPHDAFHIIVGSITIAPVALLTAASISKSLVSAHRRLRSGYEDVNRYEDQDGSATDDSIALFSQAIPKSVIALSVATGCASAVASLVIHAPKPPAYASRRLLIDSAFQCASWALLLLQVVALLVQHRPQKAFVQGIYGFLSSLLIILALLFITGTAAPIVPLRNVHYIRWSALELVQLVSALTALIAFVSLPRRPDVFFNGKPVDRHLTVSLVDRFCFSWIGQLLDLAQKRRVEPSDLPELDYAVRSRNISSEYASTSHKGPLWISLIRFFARDFALQWTLTLVRSMLAFSPQFVLYHLLQQLQTGSGPTAEAYVWVVSLGITRLLQTWIHAWVLWMTTNRLRGPVLALLTSMVFEKAMRIQDSISPPEEPTDQKDQKDQKAAAKDETKKQAAPKNPVDTTPRQSVLTSRLDCSRIASFAHQNVFIPSAVFKSVIATFALVHLIGWTSLLTGFFASFLSFPVSWYISRRFATVQINLMRFRDKKSNVLLEVFQGIRQIRFSAMEKIWEEKIMQVRKEELDQLWKAAKLMCALIPSMNVGPIIFTTVSLSVYAVLNGELSPAVAFTSLGLFGQLQTSIGFLPMIVTLFTESWTSCSRLEKFFAEPEKAQILIPSDTVSFEDATFSWPSAKKELDDSDHSRLKHVTLAFPKGELSLVTGKTGSGKSLLLAAILGEVDLISGTIRAPVPPSYFDRADAKATASNWIIPSAMAFVSQSPWIENATVKENILFNLPEDVQRYNQVLSACALEQDLAALPDGDLTEVGPKGISLSGGQRWRLALARALYSRAGTLIMDDILSAVDAHVGKWIYHHALTGELAKGRTRILATHHAALCLSGAGYLVYLDNGTVDRAQSLESVPQEDVRSLVESVEESDLIDADSQADPDTVPSQIAVEDSNKKPAKAATKEEQREVGRVSWNVYKSYYDASGGWKSCIIILAFLLVQRISSVAVTWWLKLWTSNSSANSLEAFTRPTKVNLQQTLYPSTRAASPNSQTAYFVAGYVALSFSQCFIVAIQSLILYIISLKASRNIYRRLTRAVLTAPLRWLDTVPSGRILNRFTSDMSTIDMSISQTIGGFVGSVVQAIIVIFISISSSRYLILCALVLLFAYGMIAKRYITGARDIKRIGSVSNSPIYDTYTSVLSGLATIRSFDQAQLYIDRMFDLIDHNTKASRYLTLCAQWMDIRMDILGVVFSTAVAGAIVARGVEASLAGFILSFALKFQGTLAGLLQTTSEIELAFNAVERVVEYIELPMESGDGDSPPATWPTEGRIEVENLVTGYDAELPPVLKGVSFSVAPRERLGIVGRTGAGKSTLTHSIFRLIEPREGSIRIDDINIGTLKLEDLRSRLTIIPQDPFIFSGTLRSNLDVYGLKDDDELRAALRRVHLIEDDSTPRNDSFTPSSPSSSSSSPTTLIGDNTNGTTTPRSNPFLNLSHPLSPNGTSLSLGQRQLLCLARAILTRPKILVLDEATSSVDTATDSAIQSAIRSEFQNSTLVVIAHRLSTVADFDKLLVLGDGKVLEFGTPRDLLQREEGVFRGMVAESAEAEAIRRKILGGE